MENGYPQGDEFYSRQYSRRRLRIFDKLRSDNPRLNLYLFLATCVTTFLTGWFANGSWQAGFWYGGAIISILLAHEMGHYLMCRKYGVGATLPFFIPFPNLPPPYMLNPFGTLGAVIKMESRIPDRKALFDIAVAGPLAGLVLTIPCIYYGAQFSELTEIDSTLKKHFVLGDSFLFSIITNFAIGDLPDSKDFTITLHPLAYAGWAGLFVTALNLLPIGQLDGGHIVYALIGRGHKFVATTALLAFGGIAIFMFHGWILLLIMLIWFGYKHPPTLDETPVDTKRIIIGILTILIFLLSFTPEPFKVAAF